VGFGVYVRAVRDPSLPYGHRVVALAGCVQMYRPIGFHATFSFLEHRAGPIRRDEAALVGALDELVTSRALWKEHVDAYAARRREAKRRGQRHAGADETNPAWPTHWYGDRRGGALHAIWFTLMSRHGKAVARLVAPEVLALAATCLDTEGNLDAAGRRRLGDLRVAFEQDRRSASWSNVNWPIFTRARDSLRVFRYIEHVLPAATAPDEPAVD
jgi:hypothetical protein